MARNHTPKPLYGAKKRTNDPLECSDPECTHDGLAGYRQPDGTYDWRCKRHMATRKVQHAGSTGNTKTVALLKQLGLV